MIHSSSVYVDGKAFVFPVSPGVGKTSTMLNWLHGGMSFIADEYTIIKDGMVYSYPTPLRLHDYNLRANPYIYIYIYQMLCHLEIVFKSI